ncbi:hypothetical protein AVEN_30611-1, partial [Araneus ventricosus]
DSAYILREVSDVASDGYSDSDFSTRAIAAAVIQFNTDASAWRGDSIYDSPRCRLGKLPPDTRKWEVRVTVD